MTTTDHGNPGPKVSTLNVTDLFVNSFGYAPAGVWSAPGRANLIGEHTDYTGGFVMPFAINNRARIAISARTDSTVRAVADNFAINAVELGEITLGHPTGFLGLLAGAAHVLDLTHGWDIALVSDIPIGAGLSSSAAISCAALLAMTDLDGIEMTKQDIALAAQQVEHRVLGIPCGIMDQSASMLSESGNLLFMDTRSLTFEQVPWGGGESVPELLITDSRSPHQLVDGQYAERRRLCEEATLILGVPQLREATLDLLRDHLPDLTPDQAACARHVITENQRVRDVKELVESGRHFEIGPLITASHESLRVDFKVTVPQVDLAVATARDAGALGSRMIGGGFGGCVLSVVPPGKTDHVARRIEAAFAQANFTAPESFTVFPSGGASRE